MRALAVVLVLALASSSCASAGHGVPYTSPLALRVMQTRMFETSDRAAVIAAVVQGLQDGGFQVPRVDHDAGLVSANAERVEGGGAPALVKAMFWPYSVMFPGLFGGRKHTLIEATATVVDEGRLQRVRIACRIKVLDGAEVKRVDEVGEARFYQDLFARIDKALFLDREKL